jgi:hypothetical protein
MNKINTSESLPLDAVTGLKAPPLSPPIGEIPLDFINQPQEKGVPNINSDEEAHRKKLALLRVAVSRPAKVNPEDYAEGNS